MIKISLRDARKCSPITSQIPRGKGGDQQCDHCSMQMTYHLRISWAHHIVKKNILHGIFLIFIQTRLWKTESLWNHILLQRLLRNIEWGLKRFNWTVYNNHSSPLFFARVNLNLSRWASCLNYVLISPKYVMIAGNSSPLITTAQRVKKSGKIKSWQWCWQIPCSAPSALTLYIICLNESNLLPRRWTSMGRDEKKRGRNWPARVTPIVTLSRWGNFPVNIHNEKRINLTRAMLPWQLTLQSLKYGCPEKVATLQN